MRRETHGEKQKSQRESARHRLIFERQHLRADNHRSQSEKRGHQHRHSLC